MFVTILGYIAGTITTASFFPQLIKIYRNKKADEISITMYSIITLGMIMWIIYGVYLKSYPIIIANSISTLATLLIMIFSIKYGKR
jgi:Uncharacterized conserved protein